MNNGFTRGLLIGSIIGASVGIMMNDDMMNSRTRKRIMKTGRNVLRRSGNVLGDVLQLIR
ncbi:MAG: YtxH domain-containing protein [Clostridia bacterium]|nr:YtxH domain-containing protein [Clostridia bacterium]